MKNRITIALLAIWILTISSIIAIPYALAQIKVDSAVTDTLTPTDTRKSFEYCPVKDTTQSLLTKYGVTYTIENCPQSRLYIDNWDKLDDNTKQNIVNELTINGFRVAKE